MFVWNLVITYIYLAQNSFVSTLVSTNFYSNQLFVEALDTKDTNPGGSKSRKNRMVGKVARTKPLGKHLSIYTLALFLLLKAELGKAT